MEVRRLADVESDFALVSRMHPQTDFDSDLAIIRDPVGQSWLVLASVARSSEEAADGKWHITCIGEACVPIAYHPGRQTMRSLLVLIEDFTQWFPWRKRRLVLIRVTSAVALACGLALAESGRAQDVASADKPANAPKPAATDTSSSEKNNQKDVQKNDQPNGDDSVRHHGALGVLLGTSGDGVSVVGVIPGSPADRAGLRSGDVIRYVGDQRIATAQELMDQISAARPDTLVELMIRRNGKRRIVEVNLASREAVFGKEDRASTNDPGPIGGRADPQTGPRPAPPRLPPRTQEERIRRLELQVAGMQQQINDLRRALLISPPGAPQLRSFDFDQWWDRLHHGETDNDPEMGQ